ncbi:hypothetical protein LXL04_024594 [Taraxacum kok-saghyz]
MSSSSGKLCRMSNVTRSRIPNPRGSKSRVRPASISNEQGPAGLNGSGNMADVFQSVTPHGFGIIGGRGEEFGDDFYSDEDEDLEHENPEHDDHEHMTHTSSHPCTPTGSSVHNSIGSQKPYITPCGQRLYFAGDAHGLEFCNETARKAYESFKRHLLEKYGEDPTHHIINDPDLWCESQLQRQGGKTNGRIYGIGTSDLDYLVTGIYSSGASVDTRAQQEVKTLRQDLEDLQKELGEKQAQTDYENKQRELDHQQTKLKQAQLEAQVATLVKQIGHQQSGS